MTLSKFIRFDVLGTPTPQGSKTAVPGKSRPRVIDAGTSKSRAAHRSWRGDVSAACQTAMNEAGDAGFPWDAPVEVRCYFRFPMLARRPKRLRELGAIWKETRPDIDKLTRSVLDALSVAGVYVDDARVSRLIVEKVETVGASGCQIVVGLIDDHLMQPKPQERTVSDG